LEVQQATDIHQQATRDGMTAYQLAAYEGHQSCMQYLQNKIGQTDIL
jgi:ankyrin repeat protein